MMSSKEGKIWFKIPPSVISLLSDLAAKFGIEDDVDVYVEDLVGRRKVEMKVPVKCSTEDLPKLGKWIKESAKDMVGLVVCFYPSGNVEVEVSIYS